MNRKVKRLLGRIAFYLLVMVIVLYTVFPFYWAIVSSLKSGSELFKVEFWPPHPAWDNYIAVFRGEGYEYLPHVPAGRAPPVCSGSSRSRSS